MGLNIMNCHVLPMDNTAEIKPISLSIKEAAKMTSLGERTIRKLISTGDIPSALVSGRRLIFYDGLEKFIKGGNQS